MEEEKVERKLKGVGEEKNHQLVLFLALAYFLRGSPLQNKSNMIDVLCSHLCCRQLSNRPFSNEDD